MISNAFYTHPEIMGCCWTVVGFQMGSTVNVLYPEHSFNATFPFWCWSCDRGEEMQLNK